MARAVATDARTVPAPLRPADYELSLPFGGRLRTFLVHVPRVAEAASPLPVVVNFHGAGSDAVQQRQYTAMNASADRHGYVVVYPNGTGVFPGQRRFLTFNAGGCCPPATRNDVDDVGFIDTILDLLEEKLAIDTQRLYATGMSNGGMMAHRMAADSPRIAAVASVAGQLTVKSFRPSRAVSVMEFHSVDDPRARYDARRWPRASEARRHHLPSVQIGIDRWVAHNGCAPTPVVEEPVWGPRGSLDQGQTLTRITYGPGRDGTEVVLYRFSGVGHVWPGAATFLPRLLGPSTTLVDANEVMWRFFASHPLSSAGAGR